jgi:large subunit ribosomal protein L30e
MAKRLKDKLENLASTSKVPIYHFRGNSVQLARLCGAPYKISAISLKTGNFEDINSILQEQD